MLFCSLKQKEKKQTTPDSSDEVRKEAPARVPWTIDNLRSYADTMDKVKVKKIQLDEQLFGQRRVIFFHPENIINFYWMEDIGNFCINLYMT